MDEPILLYVIRHGLAEERGEAYPDDSLRPLTATGIRRLKEIGQGLRALGVQFDEIVTSPFVRTRQTAEVLARTFRRRPPVKDEAALAAGARPQAIIAALGKHHERRRLAVVGHEPDVGELAARLIGARGALEFKKGAVCCIAVDALPPTGAGHLQWFLPPRALRRLGGS
jgi:phosphohistidine phosphatase